MPLSDTILNIQIDRQTKPVSVDGFGTQLILSEHTVVSDRALAYTTLEAMETDGWSDTDPAYTAAAAIFAIPENPGRVIIGKKEDTETWPEALAAVIEANNDWYVLHADTRTQADQEALAAEIEGLEKLAIFQTSDVNVLDTNNNDNLFHNLNDAGYDRSAAIYRADDEEWFEAAWTAKMLAKDPGSATWAIQNIGGGITYQASDITESEVNAALDKNGNVYTDAFDTAVTYGGTVASGEYLDIIRGIDWLRQLQRESYFQILLDRDKVPFSDAGQTLIERMLRSTIAQGQEVGLLAEDPEPEVNVPDPLDVPEADRADRHWTSIEWNARLLGAVHKSTVRGTVTV